MILEIRCGEARYRQRPVREPVFLVGNGQDCDMVLGDPQFPAIHFYLLTKDGRTSIRQVGELPASIVYQEFVGAGSDSVTLKQKGGHLHSAIHR